MIRITTDGTYNFHIIMMVIFLLDYYVNDRLPYLALALWALTFFYFGSFYFVKQLES